MCSFFFIINESYIWCDSWVTMLQPRLWVMQVALPHSLLLGNSFPPPLLRLLAGLNLVILGRGSITRCYHQKQDSPWIFFIRLLLLPSTLTHPSWIGLGLEPACGGIKINLFVIYFKFRLTASHSCFNFLLLPLPCIRFIAQFILVPDSKSDLLLYLYLKKILKKFPHIETIPSC